jgi:hypothetical protein
MKTKSRIQRDRRPLKKQSMGLTEPEEIRPTAEQALVLPEFLTETQEATSSPTDGESFCLFLGRFKNGEAKPEVFRIGLALPRKRETGFLPPLRRAYRLG